MLMKLAQRTISTPRLCVWQPTFVSELYYAHIAARLEQSLSAARLIRHAGVDGSKVVSIVA